MEKNIQNINPFYKGYYNSSELSGFGFPCVGKNVKIAKNCSIIGIENITIGDNVQIDENVFILANNGYLNVGSNVHIGGGSHLSCNGGIDVSDFCGLSQGVKIYSVTDDYSGFSMTNPTIPAKFKKIISAQVYLGKHVIIGSGSVILPGVKIGEGVAVGALSLVNVSLKEWSIYFGIPVKRLRNRSKNILDQEYLYCKENREKQT